MSKKVSALNESPALKSMLGDLASDLANVLTDLTWVRDRMRCQMFTVSTPVIKAGGGVLSKTGAAISYGTANGVALKIAASTDQAAYAGTVTNAKFNVFVQFVDSAGVFTSAMGTEGATLAAVVFPLTPAGKTVVSYTIINPTGTGNFVGGTTALDDVTVVPNAQYVPVDGPFDFRTTLAATTLNVTP